MKKRKMTIKITKDTNTLFEGKLIDLPLKDAYIIKKSIELFDDEDPCIIHKSYVAKGFSDSLLTLFEENSKSILNGIDFTEEFNPIDFMEISRLVFELKG